MIYIGPGGVEDGRIESTAVLHRTHPSIHVLDRLQKRPVQFHGDERWNRIERDPYARILEIEGVIDTFHETHVEVDPLHRFVAGVVDGMGMAETSRRACRGLECRSAAIDGELSLAVEDDKHLLALIV